MLISCVLLQNVSPVGVAVSEQISPAPPPREGGPTQDQGPPTHLSEPAQGRLPGDKGWCLGHVDTGEQGEGRRDQGASFLSDYEKGQTDRRSKREKNRDGKR